MFVFLAAVQCFALPKALSVVLLLLQLGNGNTMQRSFPSSSLSFGPVRMITAGNDHTCAAAVNGSVRCWGGNTHGLYLHWLVIAIYLLLYFVLQVNWVLATMLVGTHQVRTCSLMLVCWHCLLVMISLVLSWLMAAFAAGVRFGTDA